MQMMKMLLSVWIWSVYSSFDYSGMSAKANEDGSVDVSVTVKNTGKVDTSDVVEIYASNPDSSYGNAVPKKKLVGFEKVALKAENPQC